MKLKPRKSIPLVIAGIGVIIAFFVYSQRTTPALPNADALRQELLAIQNTIPTEAGKINFLKQSNNLKRRVDPELVDLDSQVISCDANVDAIVSGIGMIGGSCVSAAGVSAESVKGKYMGGQCCSALIDTKEYHDNLEKLQVYKSMLDIVLDPMHTPVALAKKWIDYDNNTTLTPAEQKIFNEAYAISKEKPCCCKCWHYYVNEGIAKKMIKDGIFNAEQIAAYWDASDICGA